MHLTALWHGPEDTNRVSLPRCRRQRADIVVKESHRLALVKSGTASVQLDEDVLEVEDATEVGWQEPAASAVRVLRSALRGWMQPGEASQD